MAKLDSKAVAKSLTDGSGFVPNQISADVNAQLEALGFRAFKIDFTKDVPEGITLEVEMPNGASPNPNDRLMVNEEKDEDGVTMSATIISSVNKGRPPLITVKPYTVNGKKISILDPFTIRVVPQDGPEGIVLMGELA